MTTNRKLPFSSDYQEGCHPKILERLMETNDLANVGYGQDAFCESAREKIRAACNCPGAAVYFLVGGTQTNATVLGALLQSYQGVLAAATGHIAVHEAGAIELGGHKVIELDPGSDEMTGKITAAQVREYMDLFTRDETKDHRVEPAAVYLSQPTECGTMYSAAELLAFRDVCDEYGLFLYVDGARLAYALAVPDNDMSLADLASLCDAFYIGGTKCGALFGEAVVFPDPELLPRFFTICKQQGAVLAKGWLLGIQFDVLFTDDLYLSIGKYAIQAAAAIKNALKEKCVPMTFDSPTNQILFVADKGLTKRLGEKVDYGFMEPLDDTHDLLRLCTSWATRQEDVTTLLSIL